jgi:hypothetical protein
MQAGEQRVARPGDHFRSKASKHPFKKIRERDGKNRDGRSNLGDCVPVLAGMLDLKPLDGGYAPLEICNLRRHRFMRHRADRN